MVWNLKTQEWVSIKRWMQYCPYIVIPTELGTLIGWDMVPL
jgi:hypothetical protein